MIEVFVERGNQLSDSRRLMEGSQEYTAALALVSIHSAIAFNDALLIKLSGQHLPTEDHMAAVNRTRSQCSANGIGADGIKHLKTLVAAKTKVSYSGQRTSIETATALSVASERFETWVRPLIK
ncbi:MAG: hypothetical protein M3R43_07590 [Acidobacteriota bacterium]|nr:hypothetical protein [Acidobacteriota bacterium]